MSVRSVRPYSKIRQLDMWQNFTLICLAISLVLPLPHAAWEACVSEFRWLLRVVQEFAKPDLSFLFYRLRLRVESQRAHFPGEQVEVRGQKRL